MDKSRPPPAMESHSSASPSLPLRRLPPAIEPEAALDNRPQSHHVVDSLSGWDTFEDLADPVLDEEPDNDYNVVEVDGVQIAVPSEQPTAPEWSEFYSNLDRHHGTQLVQLSTDKEQRSGGAENTFYSLAYYVTAEQQHPIAVDLSVKDDNDFALMLSFRLSKLGYAPSMKFEFTFSRSAAGEKHFHKGSLVFPFGGLHHEPSGVITAAVKNLQHRWVPGHRPYLDLKFESEYALTENMDPDNTFMNLNPNEPLSPAEIHFLDFVKTCKRPNGGANQLHFRLHPYPHELEQQLGKISPRFQLQELDAILPGGAREHPMFRRNMWNSYTRSHQFEANIEANLMLTRSAIAARMPCMPFIEHQPMAIYRDRVEYEVVHGYGHHLASREQEHQFAELAKNAHFVSFHALNKETVLAAIKWSSPPLVGFSADAKATVPPNTAVVAYAALGIQRGATRLGMVTARNVFGIDCDLLLHVSSESAKIVLSSAARFKDGWQQAKWFTTRLVATPNRRLARVKLETIANVADPSRPHGIHSKLWPLVNYDGERARYETVNPFRLIPGAKGRKAQEAFEQGPHGRPWTAAQRDALETASMLTNGFGCVSGNSGAGKSTLMIHKALCVASAGHYAVLCADHNSVCDTHLDNIVKYCLQQFPDVKPLRALARQTTLKDMVNGGGIDESGTTVPSSDALTALQLVFARKHSSSPTVHKHYDYTIEGHMLHNMLDPLKASDSYRGADVLLENGQTPVNAYAALQTFFREVEQHPLGSYVNGSTKSLEYWTAKKLDRVHKVIQACRVDVIRSAKLVITTNDNLISEEISQNLAPDQTCVVFIEHDEAHKSDEASTLAPHVFLQCRERIVSHCLYGDLKQMGVHQAGKVIRTSVNPPATVNEFKNVVELSLFERLHRAGFPFAELKSQNRMNPILFEPAKYRFYPEAELNGPSIELTPEQKIMMRCINGFSTPTAVQERFNWIVVKGSRIIEDRDGTSRVNFKHVLYVVDVLEKHIIPTFEDQTSDLVLIQAAYAQQVAEYDRKLEELRVKHSWPRSYLPETKTTGSCASKEKFMIIGDIMVPEYDRQQWRFMDSAKLASVFLTRCMQICLLVGGDYGEWNSSDQANKNKLLANTRKTSTAPPKNKKKKAKQDLLGGEMHENAFIYYHDFLTRKDCKIVVHDFPFDTFDQPAYLWETKEVAAFKRLAEEQPGAFPRWSRYVDLDTLQKQAVRNMMRTMLLGE